MLRKYKYNDKIYCDEDLSESVDNFGGNLYDLYLELEDKGYIQEFTQYYIPNHDEVYEDAEDAVESLADAGYGIETVEE